LLYENIANTLDNDQEHSKNEKDWTIRSQTPKCDMLAYGGGSETIMEWV